MSRIEGSKLFLQQANEEHPYLIPGVVGLVAIGAVI
jgi:hypothetical protein